MFLLVSNHASVEKRKLLLLVCVCCVTTIASAAEEHWMLMARHGECVAIEKLKRKVPELGEIRDPMAFVALMRQAGLTASAQVIPETDGNAITVNVPARELSLVFATRELCQRNAATSR